MDSYDIALLNGAETTFRVPFLQSALGEPKVGFIIVGKDSPQFIECEKRMRIESVKRRALAGKLIDTRTDEGAAELVGISIENEIRLAAAVTVGWFGFTDQSTEAPFDPALARKALEKRAAWRTAIMQALENESNFLPS
ncbi:hypothetical protein GT347_20325 [Xylophilus rhododendri]|uniref:Uncharacterized protein n=1 Tax=Xylophilus rhododendri TaxID=2697032 RepID=A0A857JBJ3_9BURK|nr:hypothetical protein [Xylophilus rhododendri]QHJ00119.1 hypothetical protein GT347_20325 [Xylophilus rhododendri]